MSGPWPGGRSVAFQDAEMVHIACRGAAAGRHPQTRISQRLTRGQQAMQRCLPLASASCRLLPCAVKPKKQFARHCTGQSGSDRGSGRAMRRQLSCETGPRLSHFITLTRHRAELAAHRAASACQLDFFADASHGHAAPHACRDAPRRPRRLTSAMHATSASPLSVISAAFTGRASKRF